MLDVRSHGALGSASKPKPAKVAPGILPLVVAVALHSGTAAAQDHCSAVLQQGIYNEYQTSTASFSQTEFRAAVCDSGRS